MKEVFNSHSTSVLGTLVGGRCCCWILIYQLNCCKAQLTTRPYTINVQCGSMYKHEYVQLQASLTFLEISELVCIDLHGMTKVLFTTYSIQNGTSGDFALLSAL